MPAVFFSKFPIKEPTTMDDKALEKNVLDYLNIFDMKKRLVL
jgi:hypothetical protein